MSAGSGDEDRLYVTVAAVLGVAPGELTDDTSPESAAAWDSLNHLNIVMAVEGEFGISLSADEVLEMGSIGAIRTILATHGVEV